MSLHMWTHQLSSPPRRTTRVAPPTIRTLSRQRHSFVRSSRRPCSCVSQLRKRIGLGKHDTLRIACVGDSITYGNGSHVGKMERSGEGNYPLTLQAMLSDCNVPTPVEIGNFGRSGATASVVSAPRRKGALGPPYNATRAYRDAVAFHPHIVLLLLGTNDSKPKVWEQRIFRRDYTHLLRVFEHLAHHIIILLPPPVTKSLGTINSVTLERHVIPTIEAIASERSLSVIDLFRRFDARTLLHDGVHPSRLGHHRIAEIVYEGMCASV